MKKKIVIISHSTYPNNSPRALRTHELSRELSLLGHEVIVYALNGNYNYEKYADTYKLKVNSLGKTFFFKFDPSMGVYQSLPMKIMTRLLNKWLSFPSIELVRNTYNVLKAEKNIDILITIANPHSIHWGAALFRLLNKQKLNKMKWIADCGDPYMGNPIKKPPSYFRYLENLFLRNSDYITVPIDAAKEAYPREFHDKIKVIPQGFRFESGTIDNINENNDRPTFIYSGAFYKNYRDPRPLLEYLETLDIDFQFIIYTKSKSIVSAYKNSLKDKLQINDYIPRDQLLKKLRSADFLLNLKNPTSEQSPSKLIDYALSNRPILSIDTQNIEEIKLIDKFIMGCYENRTIIKNIEQYDIVNVAQQFLELSK